MSAYARRAARALLSLCLLAVTCQLPGREGDGATPARAGAAPPAEAPPPGDLQRAAADLRAGDEVGACVHLSRYTQAHPDNHAARLQYAELLLRIGRLSLARPEFARLVGLAEGGPDPGGVRIRCHRRLMEIAQAEGDDYAASLHRGIGLYLLAGRPPEGGDGGTPAAPESLLCRAAAELSMARLFDPGQARPCWYLYLVWHDLGQSQLANRALRSARALAPFSELTPGEARGLALTTRAGAADHSWR